MIVRNVTARDIFFGAKSRELQDVEKIRQGINFPAGEEIEVPDKLSLNPVFDRLRNEGKLVIVSFDSSPTSILTQEEDTSGLGDLVEDAFTPTPGQTIFTLSASYLSGGFVTATVNGIEYERPDDFLISGTTFIWQNTEFSLDSSDELVVIYET